MSTSLATGPRNFIITDSTPVVNEDDNTLATVAACTDSLQTDAALNISEVDIVDTHYAIATDADATANTTAVVTATESSTAEEQFQFITAQNFEEVMGQLNSFNQQEQEVAVISVVVPMDVSDTSSNEANANIATLSAINGNADLAQQMANGQLTVLQTQTADGEEAVPQYITVTVSAQDGGQNYQVQYVDTDLYHSNSSQTQMSYPFCPVADYQTNGQTYYAATTCSSYAATTALNTTVTNSSTLPFLVPVDENLLLNSSSQSQSRDSPNSLTDVAYLHETQRTPQTPTSTSTANSINGSNIGLSISNGNIGRGDLLIENEQGHCGSKIASATIKWLSHNYETADGVSLPRSTLYNHYIQHCQESKLEAVNAASFGKLIRSVFSGLRTRRLGTRGNSKYHYYGIRIKPDSLLNHMMEEKQCYNNAHKDDTGNLDITTGTGNITDAHILNAHDCQHSSVNLPNYITNKHNRKSNFKPETFETCIQFLGDGTNAIPPFPPIDLGNAFNNELTCEDVEIFRSMYREHCENFLDAILNLEFHTVEFLWREFWRDNTDHNCLDECTSEEKYFSKSKLYMLCHCSGVQEFVREVDYQFYQNLVDVIIPDVLRSIPNALTQAIRNFAKNMEVWSCEAMMGVPEPMLQIKSAAVSAFCQTLRRYTSLNHLAQAARAVLQNSTQIAQMLSDLNRVDFHNVQEQASWVCQCDAAVVQRLENDFKTALQQQSSLEQWASWLQLVVDTSLQEYRDKQNYAKAARHFLLKWSFYSSLVIRDLTLRSASSFGSFHLIRLLYDEYMFYLVEHKIAEAQQKTAIAVICERTKKDSEYDLNYQLEFITSENIISEPINKRMKNE